MACLTHCCPKHGCKYGKGDCTIATGVNTPMYPPNNGCEYCYESEMALVGATVYLWWDEVYSSLETIEGMHNSTIVFLARDGQVYGVTYSPIDEMIIENAQVFGWCNLQEIAIKEVK